MRVAIIPVRSALIGVTGSAAATELRVITHHAIVAVGVVRTYTPRAAVRGGVHAAGAGEAVARVARRRRRN